MAEYASPVCEKVESSTPVMRTPSAIGKVDFCDAMSIWWRTTDCARNKGVSVVVVVRRRWGIGKASHLEVALGLGGALEVGELCSKQRDGDRQAK